MDKKLLKKYFDNNDFKAIAIVVGSKKMVLENDIHLDYENEIIIYPLKIVRVLSRLALFLILIY